MPSRRRSAALQSFSLRRPNDVDIVLDDEDETTFVSSYTNLDKISGQVMIRCPKDTIFHELEISFEGVTDTCVYSMDSGKLTAIPVICRARHVTKRLTDLARRYREGGDDGSQFRTYYGQTSISETVATDRSCTTSRRRRCESGNPLHLSLRIRRPRSLARPSMFTSCRESPSARSSLAYAAELWRPDASR